MKKIILLSLLSFSFFAKAQNLPACDTLIINCCTFDTLGPNTITLYADNHSSVLFDYPGFLLLNQAMDTIAKETVTYFGIGTGFQPHTLDIVAPLILPFSGYLELHTGFFTQFACSFHVYIPDTVNSVHDLQNRNALKVYPNPADQFVVISPEFVVTAEKISIYNMMGVLAVQVFNINSETTVDIHTLPAGMYRVEIGSGERVFHAKFVKQ